MFLSKNVRPSEGEVFLEVRWQDIPSCPKDVYVRFRVVGPGGKDIPCYSRHGEFGELYSPGGLISSDKVISSGYFSGWSRTEGNDKVPLNSEPYLIRIKESERRRSRIIFGWKEYPL